MYDDDVSYILSNVNVEEGEQESVPAKTEEVPPEKVSDDSKIHSEAHSVYSISDSLYGQSPLRDLSDHQLIEFILDIDVEYTHLKYENLMFKQFLLKNDPAALEGHDALLTYLIKPPGERGPLPTTIPNITTASESALMRRGGRSDSVISLSAYAEGRVPKINLSQKSDMVLKAMEETQANLEAFLRKSYKLKQNLKADLEEYTVRESDFIEAREIFENNIVLLGVDPITQRIPAEKFTKYMDEWLKSAQLNVEKLRLRTATLKIEYKKVSAILEQRKELGENVHAIDFDQLKIDNKHFRDKIDQKSLYLLELKRMNGGHNLTLSNHKKYLHNLQKDFNDLNLAIAAKEKLIQDTEEQCHLMEHELKRVRLKYERFKKLKSTFKVPSVIEYVKLKSKLYDLKKNIKVWERRKNIQDITMNACLRQMKTITGSSVVHPYWLEDPASEDSLSVDYVTVN